MSTQTAAFRNCLQGNVPKEKAERQSKASRKQNERSIVNSDFKPVTITAIGVAHVNDQTDEMSSHREDEK